MKITKMFYGEKRLKDVYVGATKWQVFKFKAARMTKRVMIVMAAFSTIGWSVYMGSNYVPRTVYADREVIKVMQATSTAPVMDRIASCESGKHQIDPKTGQVLIHVNSDGTTDIGYMQINSVHFKNASALGYDLTKESDNRAYGDYLYKNKGTEDWYSSKGCWSK